MHHVAAVDWAALADQLPHVAGAEGLRTATLVGGGVGAVHTELTVGSLEPGGWVDGRLHAFEEAFYVLSGAALLSLGADRHALGAGDFALVPVGMVHSWANPGPDEVRWLRVNTPRQVGAEEGRQDTFLTPSDADARHGPGSAPAFGDPRLRYVGHYAGTPPQADALAVADPARGRRPAGMDTALLAYSGISVKMLVDRAFGADLLTMFTVDYEPNGAAQIHDHPFEETYFFLAGEIEGVIEGVSYQLHAGDVLFAGVGATHGFFNTGSGRVRWIETQAPQPPARHAYRWVSQWEQLNQD